MLIVIFRCEISQVTSVPKFWWPWVSVRQQLCVYRWGDGTRLRSFEMWHRRAGWRDNLWFTSYSSFQGGSSPARRSTAWPLTIHTTKQQQQQQKASVAILSCMQGEHCYMIWVLWPGEQSSANWQSSKDIYQPIEEKHKTIFWASE